MIRNIPQFAAIHQFREQNLMSRIKVFTLFSNNSSPWQLTKWISAADLIHLGINALPSLPEDLEAIMYSILLTGSGITDNVPVVVE